MGRFPAFALQQLRNKVVLKTAQKIYYSSEVIFGLFRLVMILNEKEDYHDWFQSEFFSILKSTTVNK